MEWRELEGEREGKTRSLFDHTNQCKEERDEDSGKLASSLAIALQHQDKGGGIKSCNKYGSDTLLSLFSHSLSLSQLQAIPKDSPVSIPPTPHAPLCSISNA